MKKQKEETNIIDDILTAVIKFLPVNSTKSDDNVMCLAKHLGTNLNVLNDMAIKREAEKTLLCARQKQNILPCKKISA